MLKCDFLALHISEQSAAPSFHPSEPQVLLSLPSSSFEVVTMSLVLNYLPSAELREQMIRNAHKLLIGPPPRVGSLSEEESSSSSASASASSSSSSSASAHSGALSLSSTEPHRTGLLLIMEKNSIFCSHGHGSRTGKAARHSTAPSPTPQEWIRCICSMGFERVSYTSEVFPGSHHVHLFAFRAVHEGSSKVTENGARLHIKSDFRS